MTEEHSLRTPLGHLWHESNDTNAAATYGYDAVGKLISESSCRPSNFATAYVGTTATYDSAGIAHP